MEEDRHFDEGLTDNTKIKYCKQCKDCAFWGNSDAFSNAYDKSCCDMFPYPQFKPEYVINSTADCQYYLSRVEK